MKTNFLFFLNSYNDLCQTATPYLNNFKWSREINGVPYKLENSQQIQIDTGITSPDLIPYPFSTPTNSGTDTITTGSPNMTVIGHVNGISPGNLIVGVGIPVGTTVLSLGPTQNTFTVSAANATVGAIYSNNGQNFTVTSTIVAGTTLICTGSGDPSSSGTLTLVSGTGDATIAFSAVTESTPLVMSQPATASGSAAISFYAPGSFLYLESDQQVSVIYNNGSPMAINPIEINGIVAPGVFFVNGPIYSLTVTNPSATTANVFFALMG